MIPSFPQPVVGINYDFRCEAVTTARSGYRLGRARPDLPWSKIGGLQAAAANYGWTMGRGAVAVLKLHELYLAERLALLLLELRRRFWDSKCSGYAIDSEGRHKGSG